MTPPADFAAFRSDLLSLYDPPLRAKTTRMKVRQVLDLLEGLGVGSPRELTPRVVARFTAEAARGRGAATTRGLLGYLRVVCRYALAEGHIRRCPFAFRRDWLSRSVAGDEPEAAPRHHPAAQIAAVLGLLEAEAAAGGRAEARLRALVATVAFTGLRKMEALGLLAADVDLGGRMIRLKGNARRGLKTRKAGQPVPVPEALARVLADWMPRAGSPWLFPTRSGAAPWTGGEPGRRPLDQVKAAGARAGVAGLTFASLRHSWATHAETLWRLSGPTIQRVMRHASERTSLRWYRHADEDNLREAVRSIDFRTGEVSRAG